MSTEPKMTLSGKIASAVAIGSAVVVVAVVAALFLMIIYGFR